MGAWRVGWAGAENGLGGVLPQIASMAGPSGSSSSSRDLFAGICSGVEMIGSMVRALHGVFCETCNEAFQRWVRARNHK